MSPSASPDNFSIYRHPTDRIMPRNQREAGIEWRGWEDRIKPKRPWISIIAITATAAGGAGGLLFAAARIWAALGN